MSKLNPVGKMLALELAPLLPRWWEKNPDGLTVKMIMRLSGIDYSRCHAAFLQLEELGIADILQRPDRSGLYLVPLDYIPPPVWDITAKQRAVVDWMATHMDSDGSLRASMREICFGAMRSKGIITAIIESLDRKGYLEILERGRGTKKTLFRVWPNGDGPRGHSPFVVAGR
jgi:hypothetical protein